MKCRRAISRVHDLHHCVSPKEETPGGGSTRAPARGLAGFDRAKAADCNSAVGGEKHSRSPERLSMGRSTKQVFEDHLRQRRRGNLEEDIARNYADDVVLLTARGIFRGKAGLRRCCRLLHRELPCVRYEYRLKLVEGPVAFSEWTARCDGADSFLIRNGRIVAQTIHYTVRREGRGRWPSS